MSSNFGYIDIILLAMIAGFIILRLRSILGRKTGHEDKIYPSFASKKFEEFIRAETKQSISTIMEFDTKPIVFFDKYPKEHVEITNFINNLDWRFPWNAGAQVAGFCKF